jgi:aryl-alcohol dehydrogenase-like predicted oxidoreductase
MNPKVTRRDLGASGIQTPALILGGNVFGWTADKATSFAVLDRFAEAGGTLIDTADVYSAWVPGHQGGESEAIIGEWLQQSGKRGKVKVATKVGMLDGEGGTKLAPARIAAACDASLKRLGVETIDLYFAHQDDEAVPQEDVLAAFDALIKAGKAQAIGASNFHAGRLKAALDIATRESLPHYRALQNEYHLLSRHKYEGELQDLCVQYNIGAVPFYGLASGYLTGKYRSEADLGKSVRGGRMTPFMQGKGPAMLAAMDAIAAETGATLAQIALAWIAAQPGITAPIASATSLEQVDELLGALNVTLTPAQLDTLTAAGA